MLLTFPKRGFADARILVVDDHDDSRIIARIVLEHDGYEVIEASTGPEALRCALDSLPDVILMDLILPELDGLEVTRRICADPAMNHARIVAMTASTRAHIQDDAFIAGCHDFLAKPFHIVDLRRVVLEQLTAARPPLRIVWDSLAASAKASALRHRATKGQYQLR
jgi:CheY-like chemotaxis protein